MPNLELKGFKGLRELDNLTIESNSCGRYSIQNLPLSHLTPGKYQPRRRAEQETLVELSQSIKSYGILQPLIARKKEPHCYEIIAGERRWHAAKMAGLREVPVIIKEVEDRVVLAFSLIENIQRENLNPMEEAMAFWRFKAEFNMTHLQIAKMVGRSRVSITNTLRLLLLVESVKEMVVKGHLDMGHARTLLTLTSDEQSRVAQIIVEKKLSVRDAEKLVNTMKYSQQNKVISENKNSMIYREKYENWSAALSKKFCTDVTIKLNNRGAGKIILRVNSPDKIDWLIEHVKMDEEGGGF